LADSFDAQGHRIGQGGFGIGLGLGKLGLCYSLGLLLSLG
jgi:hypothetical protein